MKLDNKTKTNISLIVLFVLIFMYNFYIQNGLEKLFSETYFDYNLVKRPLARCSNTNHFTGCIGMPSGHAESFTLLSCLLYFYKFIPFYYCILFIFLFSFQRIISNMHTLNQVLVGITTGYMYASIYKYFDLSMYSFLIVFSIGLFLILLNIFKIDKEVYGPIPEWVDPEMIPSIKKKQDVPLYIKIGTIYTSAYIQDKTFINWRKLEECLDIIVERIQKSGQQYDAVIGIKTGGAIISDYVSQKLGLPNYKVKLSRSDYNCDKKPHDTIHTIFQRQIMNNYGEYTVCEGIDDNLSGKNIILIDEMVFSGKTMIETINYLKNEKHVSKIYPTCVSLSKKRYTGKIDIDYVLPGLVLIWPWGYDN